MSKKNKIKKKKIKNKRSTINQHKKIGKKLISPFNNFIPKETEKKLTSWINYRIPEMLWACLVAHTFPRELALTTFREIAYLGHKNRDNETSISAWGLAHSQLAKLPQNFFEELLKIITKKPLGYAALKPLLLLESLPGYDRWKLALDVDIHPSDFNTLAEAVGNVIDHQSKTATDVRWLCAIFSIISGQINIPHDFRKQYEEVLNYPNKGNLESVRPCIRSTEMAIRSLSNNDDQWCESFWQECLEKTECVASLSTKQQTDEQDIKKIYNKLIEVYDSLYTHWFRTISSTSVDAKHDAVFGFGFYTLALITELLSGKNRYGIVGRLVLKTLTDCRISLAHLLKENSSELWSKFRKFGSGQAKLALLKLEELEEDTPSFISKEILEYITNEDIHEEFINIDLGNWSGKDLRKMSEITSTKDDYDKFYSWTSSYSHAQWSAMRDACFITCFNPLHRLHRIPRKNHRLMEDTLIDAVNLANKLLDDINTAYDGFSARL